MGSVNARQAARNQPCTLRLPGICCGDWRTTVLAHVRLWGSGGMGKKPPDSFGFFACAACHDAYDKRRPGFNEDDAQDQKSLIRALCETHERLEEMKAV